MFNMRVASQVIAKLQNYISKLVNLSSQTSSMPYPQASYVTCAAQE